MRLVIGAADLPGRSWSDHRDVHVALQVGREPHDPVPGDAGSASWETEVTVLDRDGVVDFRGPAVQGKPGERFVYLTWGELRDGSFSMFRRAKLMLADLGPDVVAATEAVGTLSLTDAKGAPLCGRVRPHAITWTLT